MTTPYTYRVKHVPSGKWYYGVRYADGCSPDDLFRCYFTSSRTVCKLIEEDGVKSFVTEVRKTFDKKEDAIYWEHRVLRKIIKWDICLNENAFPAVKPEARARGNRSKAEIQKSTGLTIFQQAGKKWTERQHHIDEATGLTFKELRRQKYNNSLDSNGTRYVPRGNISGDKNPAKKPEVKKKISNTLKKRIASGEIIPWPTGKKLQYVSDRMKGNNITVGMKWYNDGTKDFRLVPSDFRVLHLNEGRLFSATRGMKYEQVTCPHCRKAGSGGNMKRFHFDKCSQRIKST